jgi:Transcriptional regulatory protein, C terminal
MPRVGDLLERQSAGNFVGRENELIRLEQLLAGHGPLAFHVYGIPGIGKSRLLNAFARVARARGATVLLLDCRRIEPTEAGLLSELGLSLGGPRIVSPEEIATRLSALGTRIIVALDTYEVFRLMDTWLRQTFLPILPDNVRFILCGRESPAPGWLSDPGWNSLFVRLRLDALSRPEAVELLSRAGAAEDDVRRLAGICHGHPLALTLASALQRTEGAIALGAGLPQQVLEELCRLFLADIKDRQTRRALEAACVVRRVTLPILSALLADASPHDAQERLRDLPFVQTDRDGLQIHDAVRDTIAGTLRASDPQGYQAYRRSAYRHYMAQLRDAVPGDFWRCTADLLYLLENPAIREAFFPSQGQEYAVEPARPEDAPAILDIIERHESPLMARYLTRWWAETPETFSVTRDRSGKVAGFYCAFDPTGVPRHLAREDPITRSWLDHESVNPMPREQRALFLRRWLSSAEGEAPSAVQAACWIDLKRRYLELRPTLRRVYLTVSDLQPYAAAAQRLGFRVIDGAAYYSAMLDFGPSSVDGWLARLVAAELGVDDSGLLDPAARELVLNGRRVSLTRLEFGCMEFLQSHAGEAVPRTTLLANVWEQSYDGGSNVVDVIVRGLRKKMGEHASLIETVHGIGYRLRREA